MALQYLNFKKLMLFRKELFNNLSVEECKKAVVFYLLYTIGMVLIMYLGRSGNWINNVTILGTLYSVVFFFVVLIANKKKLYSLGLSPAKLLPTIMIMVIAVCGGVIKNRTLHNLPEALLSSVAIFFTEEFVYRGYLWTRLVVLLGKYKGTILCGVLWGVMHLLNPYIHDSIDVLVILNAVLSGIVGHFFFALLYSMSGNIYLPTAIHIFPHFFL